MKFLKILLITIFLSLSLFSTVFANTENICAKNPCAQNPCAQNPCTQNPCAQNPCAQNPCAQNPCAKASQMNPKLITRPKGTKLYAGAPKETLVKEGKKLWHDNKLSTNNLSCNTCHMQNQGFNKTFAKPYPHAVDMAHSQFGRKEISLDEFVQICMVIPMASNPLPWDSRKLAALTAYTEEVVQKNYIQSLK